MIDKKFKAVFWDFGGVITSSPFQAFSSFEKENNLPKDFIRRVNSTNPYENAWAKLESSKIKCCIKCHAVCTVVFQLCEDF